MNIQYDLRSKKLWIKAGENQEIGHVMYMDDIVMFFNKHPGKEKT